MSNIDVNKPIAVCGICNNLSLCVYDIKYDIDDVIVCGYSNKPWELIEATVFYDDNGQPFIHVNEIIYYLDEFIKC